MTLEHRVLLTDCLAPTGLPSLGARSVAHAIFDPPYSERVHDRLAAEGRALPFQALSEPLARAVAQELCRVVREWIIIFCDEMSFSLWVKAIEGARGVYVRPGYWWKDNPMPHCDLPSIAIEPIVLARAPRPRGSGRIKWNRGGEPALYHCSMIESGVPRVHPTQKPLLVMEGLVRDFTSPGDFIIDPFCGGGSTGVAAKRLGRAFLGFDNDQQYVEVASRRLAITREQLEIPLRIGRLPKLSPSCGPRPPNSTIPGYPSLFTEGELP